jgi:hypothetical protein
MVFIKERKVFCDVCKDAAAVEFTADRARAERAEAENSRLRHFAKLALERVLWGDNHHSVKRAVYDHLGTTDTQELIAAETAMANGFVLFGRPEDIKEVRRLLEQQIAEEKK